LVRANIYEIVIIVLANILIAWIVFTSVGKVNAEQSRDIFAISATILGISTATLVFFGDYVQKTTSWLFEKRSALAEFREAIPRMGKVFLKLIFLQLLLWWTVISTGGSTLLAIIAIYRTEFVLVGVVALALLLATILTIIFWMSLFVLLNTPGRITYRALTDT
jgi:hypothetical protein